MIDVGSHQLLSWGGYGAERGKVEDDGNIEWEAIPQALLNENGRKTASPSSSSCSRRCFGIHVVRKQPLKSPAARISSSSSISAEEHHPTSSARDRGISISAIYSNITKTTTRLLRRLLSSFLLRCNILFPTLMALIVIPLFHRYSDEFMYTEVLDG